MNSSDWIDAGTACAVLGVKPQTLCAYVSRGQVRAEADAGDARRSLYARADVEALLRQNRRPRARAEVAEQAIRWGDPVLETEISEVRDGMLWLRGRSVEHCAGAMTLEEMAAHLCAVSSVTCPEAGAPQGPATPLGRALSHLAGAVEAAPPLTGMNAGKIAEEAGRLISGVTNALLGQAGGGLIHLRLARAWGQDAQGAEDLRRALVLLGDHELNPSTFAVRIAASTGASLPAALLCGLSTLSGPRHGGASVLARQALVAAMAGRAEAFLSAQAGTAPYGFGYGHPLYPEGDPRARLLLGRIDPEAPARRAALCLSERLGLAPNVDTGLAALALARGLPEEAPFTIFAAGRLAGWIAHAAEQARSAELIRPRARYRVPG
ncbi:citrate synthase [Salipiger sp. H15]|uniref:citrate synthase (unknown stereospecificity) n=1 Tax=Alloyangia sp. H15 TaxID=3029062 RepID=A0AAU8AEV9_9RHOB